MEWHLPANKPSEYKTRDYGTMVYCDSQRYYVGSLGLDGKWYDRDSDEVLEAIDAWAFLPEEPTAIEHLPSGEEWNAGNGPVKPTYQHFLLADTATGEITYKNISSRYFDSKNKTFPEVSHWMALPNLPLRLANSPRILKSKKEILDHLKQKPELKALVLEPFNDACLALAIDEIYNTTTNGVRRNYILSGGDLIREIISRWAFRVNNALNEARGNTFVEISFDQVQLPAGKKQQEEIEATLDLVTSAMLA
ncbi:hypothetical protein PQ469_24845 [Mucilaginibacter sp. KACC 22773]|uniref:hypothetical protein n=1 Tax=Mucilaginibacter sp. KACC 22773 TaxID=3025671 RepID=UPI002366279E|nr:hypothetical protein [Mucilaginibacter sp. KACC 22773]WDF77117.1 hypothetical protein PQ469_24845 [Mucilaginibacter sp. KACC 22773]